MRSLIVSLIAGLVFLTMGDGVALADGMIVPGAEGPDYLAVRYHRVSVDIVDGHAVTRVEQEFYNPYPFRISGRYLFPVPPEAMLSRFQAVVDGKPQAITRQNPASTNTALYGVVAQRRDPSLLGYVDWETLAFDLELPPGDSRQMSLEYDEVLAPSGGLYRYRYVLSTERYSSQPLQEVSLKINLRSSSGLSGLYSPAYPVQVDRLDSGRARISWQAHDVRPSQDFELFFAPAQGGFGGGLLTGRREDQGHFLFLFAPQAGQAAGEAIPKDIVFVVDRSGSMSGEKIEQARNALHFILGQLNQADRFSIVGFDHRLLVFADKLQPVDRSTLSTARHFVDGLTPDGDTDLEAALQAGLEILAHSEVRDASRLIVFLTDGLPTAGVTDEELIPRLVGQANQDQKSRLHVFGVGYDVNTHLLDRLAADNGGTVTYVQSDEGLEAALTGFYESIAYPVLTDVEVVFEGLLVEDVYPRQMPDLFQGSSLLLTGRYRATASVATVRVRGQAPQPRAGQAGDEERVYTYRFNLEQIGGHDFVPRLWATRRIGELLDRVRVAGEDQDLVDEIRALGLEYGLVTPYTTMVVQAQAEGPASAANMALYGDLTGLNLAWGQTTVQARVQNQSYQQATQANLASGANVVNLGQHSLVQFADQNLDLSLLRGQPATAGPITAEWIEQNIKVDRYLTFGSQEYFALAEDPAVRPLLQSGVNVMFAYQGQVIAVQDSAAPGKRQGMPALGLPQMADLASGLMEMLFSR